jgi:superfamily I DNA and/or RNA helicase
MENEVYSLDPQTRTYDPNFITMLKLNFRSHPDILHIPNLLFYDNLLEPKSTSAMRDPIVGTSIFPVILNINIRREGQAIEFYSVQSKERREGSSPSYFNPFEANVVVKYVTALMRLNLPSAYRVRMDQIGVVTPYKRQVRCSIVRFGVRNIYVCLGSQDQRPFETPGFRSCGSGYYRVIPG